MSCDILVDGYNVIKNNLMFQMLEIKHLELARAQLIKQLKNRYRHATDRVIVVFDGSDAREQVSHDEHIRIIFSRHGETADSVMVRLAAEARAAGRIVRLYSDDGEVRQNVVEQGGSTHTTRQLTTQLTAPPRDIEIRARHRQAMRRMYGIDPQYKAADEEDYYYQPHKKRKKSPHRSK